MVGREQVETDTLTALQEMLDDLDLEVAGHAMTADNTPDNEKRNRFLALANAAAASANALNAAIKAVEENGRLGTALTSITAATSLTPAKFKDYAMKVAILALEGYTTTPSTDKEKGQ